ncbi:MAG TPA: hypothetical protein VMF88_00415 [Bacteroidota bacterium]|nr:hypothetical protein [Bacteroidota bacterium]
MAAAGYSARLQAQSAAGSAGIADASSKISKDDVIFFKKAAVGDDLVITMLATSHPHFDLRLGDVIDLINAGVREKGIGALVEGKA